MKVIPGLPAGAKKIFNENQYIKSSQSEVTKLLAATKEAKDNNTALVVGIILGKLFDKAAVKAKKKISATSGSLYTVN